MRLCNFVQQLIQKNPFLECHKSTGSCYDCRCSRRCRIRWSWRWSLTLAWYLRNYASAGQFDFVTIAFLGSLQLEDHVTLARELRRAARANGGGFYLVREPDQDGDIHYHGIVLDLPKEIVRDAVLRVVQEVRVSINQGVVKDPVRAARYSLGALGYKGDFRKQIHLLVRSRRLTATISQGFWRGTSAAQCWATAKEEYFKTRISSRSTTWRITNGLHSNWSRPPQRLSDFRGGGEFLGTGELEPTPQGDLGLPCRAGGAWSNRSGNAGVLGSVEPESNAQTMGACTSRNGSEQWSTPENAERQIRNRLGDRPDRGEVNADAHPADIVPCLPGTPGTCPAATTSQGSLRVPPTVGSCHQGVGSKLVVSEPGDEGLRRWQASAWTRGGLMLEGPRHLPRPPPVNQTARRCIIQNRRCPGRAPRRRQPGT